MINQIGFLLLFIAFFASVVALTLSTYGALKNNSKFLTLGKQFTIACAFSAAASIILLATLFLTDSYFNHYVWQFSSKNMFWVYKLASVWGGMNGSMLLWGVLVSVFAGIAAFKVKILDTENKLHSWTLACLNLSPLFFLFLTLFIANPFQFLKSPTLPPDGNGLNPLLQNPLMAIHPPILYHGFTLFSVSFAYALAALIAKDSSGKWLQESKIWTFLSWAFLTVGITLGGAWAYVELGWGGFWAWDPVENASLLPWLTATAFIHSKFVEERRGMLKLWNIWLIILTYLLTIFGTFLTRSGIVQSVHAFAEGSIGPWFLGYLAAMFLLPLVFTIINRKVFASKNKFEALLSRETAFLLNNILFLGLTIIVIWGTMYPVFSETVLGNKKTLGPEFFNAVTGPIFLVLLFLMGIGSVVGWRDSSSLKGLIAPSITSLIVATILILSGIHKPIAITAFSLAWFVIYIVVSDILRSIKNKDLSNVVTKQSSKIGGHIVHIGVAIMAIGITASLGFKQEVEFSLAKGEKYIIDNYQFKLNDYSVSQNSLFEALTAAVTVTDKQSEKNITELSPSMRFYLKNGETTTEVALNPGLKNDLYLVLGGLSDDNTRASFKLFINPLQTWLWIGGCIVALGSMVIIGGLFRKKN